MTGIADFFPWAGVILTVVLLIILWVRTKPATAQEALAQIQEMSAQASGLVAAAEQLWLTGKLPKDDRFRYVADRLAIAYPDLDEDQLRTTIEAAVYWLKTGMQQTKAAKQTKAGG